MMKYNSENDSVASHMTMTRLSEDSDYGFQTIISRNRPQLVFPVKTVPKEKENKSIATVGPSRLCRETNK